MAVKLIVNHTDPKVVFPYTGLAENNPPWLFSWQINTAIHVHV